MAITRRDFLNGTLLALGSWSLSPLVFSQMDTQLLIESDYPPLLHGLRGSHPGSFEHAHELALSGRKDWGETIDTREQYDLIVVGAGVSGLASAYFFREAYGNHAKILILDNHSDFGGHAQRNEFEWQGKKLIGYAGSQSLESPNEYSKICKRLLTDIGIDFRRFEDIYDFNFFKHHGLKAVTHFDKKTFGTRKILPFTFCEALLYEFPGVLAGGMTPKEAIAKMPITAKDQLRRLFEGPSKQVKYPDNMPYFEYLKQEFSIDSKEVFSLLRHLSVSGDFGCGADVISLSDAREAELLGFEKIEAPISDEELLDELTTSKDEQYIHHFPDGNASVARLLVKSLIPTVADFEGMAGVVTAKFDYRQLDTPSQKVKIRLNSTAIHVKNVPGGVNATYFTKGKAYQVAAKQCIMAGYNMMIPHIIPTLPSAQKAALKKLIKSPLLYTNVLLDNWEALKNLGIGMAYSPGRMHKVVAVDYPVSLGSYHFSKSPKEPILLHLEHIPLSDEYGKDHRMQFKEGRAKLLGMSFKQIEDEVKEHLADMLGSGGFDPNQNIKAITANRWAHGYSYGGNSLFDPDINEDRGPHIIGRMRFENIAIANSDSGANAYLDIAVNQAWRAVNELNI